VALLEEGVGGWKFWGEFRFDAKWADRNFDEDCDCDDTSTPYTDTGETDFTVSRYRIWMSKKVDDKVTFIARLGGADATFERYYLDVKLPWDATMWVGKWNFDWEAESGLYADNDAWFTDQTLQGFYFNKPFNMGDFSIFLAHREGTACCDDCDNPYDPKTEGYVYGARVDFHFNEQFRMAVQGIVQTYADATWSNWIDGSMGDWTTIWVDAGVKFTPDIELKGAYFWQQWECGSDGEEFDPNAWKVILDVKQEAFGFTSLWIEYASFDHRFKTVNAPYDEFVMGRDCDVCNSPNRSISHTLTNQGGLGGNYYDGGTALLVRLNQRWNDKWETFQRYVKFDLGAPIPNGWVGKFDYVQEWNIGVRYWYTPSLMFELSYSDFDKESNNLDCDNGWDTNMIRLRTYVSF
ncbi:MAG TPA: S-layer protein, partial [Synergistales bacterium]|nr:S-layer protein [Synergistales bacterium]